jgi:hypothetical protein
VRLERRQFRVPGVPDFLGPHRIPPQHVAYALIRQHLGQFLINADFRGAKFCNNLG